MGNRPAQRDQIADFSTWKPPKLREGKRLSVTVVFPDGLYKQMLKEAIKRQWSMAHLIRHLCEASIEGIE